VTDADDVVVVGAAVEAAEYPKPGGGADEGPKRRGRPPGSGGGYKATKLKTPIQNGYIVASKVAIRWDPGFAMLLREHAEPCAQAWDEWAKTNAFVRKALTALVEMKSKGGVASAHAPFLLYFADRLHILERIPITGEVLQAFIENHVNELLMRAIAEGLLEAEAPTPEDAEVFASAA
jgi:hypothetical protein